MYIVDGMLLLACVCMNRNSLDLHGYHMQQLQRLSNCSYVIPCGDAPQGAQGEGGH